MRYIYVRLIMALLWIISAYLWGDWKNWRKYYPTMLFMGMGDLIYHSVFHNKPLWIFQPDILVSSLNELFVIFTIFFSTVLLFLTYFPEKLLNQIIYIILWGALYISIESFSISIGMQKNYNGWNIWWSILFNIVQFPLLITHHKRPILAWIMAFIFLGIIMRIFNITFIITS